MQPRNRILAMQMYMEQVARAEEEARREGWFADQADLPWAVQAHHAQVHVSPAHAAGAPVAGEWPSGASMISALHLSRLEKNRTV